MRIGPAPLIPAFPVQPDRQEVYPKALGQAFVGNPRLALPEVKAKIPERPAAATPHGPNQEAAPMAAGTGRPAAELAQDLPNTYARLAGERVEGAGANRLPTASRIDLKA